MSSTGCGRSIVEYNTFESGHSCGYCHSKPTAYTNGMWAHTMTVEDYQDLIDRGWRRSGHHCYKPIMTSTCCPMYTIKCAAQEFKVSKSQKKILKRFHNFLAYGICSKNVKPSLLEKTEVMHSIDMPEMKQNFEVQSETINMIVSTLDKVESGDAKQGDGSERQTKGNEDLTLKMNKSAVVDDGKIHTSNTPGEGQPREVKSRQMKAKQIRIERKRQKLRNMGLSEKEIEEKMLARKRKVTVKTLEDFLNAPQPENPAHKLEIRLVRPFPASPGFEETYEVYKRYQTHVHKDSPEKLSYRRYERFLVTSPLEIRLVLVKSPELENSFAESASLFAKYQIEVHKETEDNCNAYMFSTYLVESPLEPSNEVQLLHRLLVQLILALYNHDRVDLLSGGCLEISILQPKKSYGSYHQQYWLDGKLIAVGVIDILPKCLSSVYFLYDPDYMWLSLGTYGALREVEFVRKLTRQYPDIKYYYMGFYIHSCIKMRYKAAFKPSYLLCPEAYTWHAIQTCLPKLDVSKYSRLNEDLSAKDSDSIISISDVTILFNRTVMSFASYSKLKNCSPEEREEILKYATLVGMTCARRILLYR